MSDEKACFAALWEFKFMCEAYCFKKGHPFIHLRRKVVINVLSKEHNVCVFTVFVHEKHVNSGDSCICNLGYSFVIGGLWQY